AMEILKTECFYKEAHQRIFSAIVQLFDESKPIDILTVTDVLKKSDELDLVGGPYYISQLTNRVGSAANIEYHSRIILEKYISRELIRVSSDTIKEAYQDSNDVLDLLDHAESELFTLTQGNLKTDYQKVDNLLTEAFAEIEAAKEHEEGLSGIPSGFIELDRMTSGWQKNDLVIVAARPGMGKTAFVLSMMRNMAVDLNKPVGMFSLEMGGVQLVNRLISSETGLNSEKLKKGDLKDYEWQVLHKNVKGLSEAPIYIDDTAGLSVFQLRAKCRRMKSQHDVQAIIIDYLQLMTAGEDKGNREQEISTISRSIKSIAKELDVPILALSQLSRNVELRGGTKRPQLSDLRESGAIEQDADLVTFLYRPEYYELEQDDQGNPTKNMAELIVAKHRNGPLGTV
ncbi:MAG: replicative DNA helicase, partial [Flavobacteriales bacterium]